MVRMQRERRALPNWEIAYFVDGAINNCLFVNEQLLLVVEFKG